MSEDRALITPSQADRIAALPFIPRNSIAGQDREGVLAGKYDDAQAIQAFARHASEREAIGRAAGREEAARTAETFYSTPRGPLYWSSTHIAAAIRAALPVDGGKDGADGKDQGHE